MKCRNYYPIFYKIGVIYMRITVRPSFRTNLVIILIAMILISTSVFFLIYYNLSNSPLENILRNNLNNISINSAQLVDDWLNEKQDVIISLSQSPSILSSDPIQIKSSLESYNKIHKCFCEIALVSANGDTLYDSTGSKSVNVSDREYFIFTKNLKPSISDRLISRTTNDPVIIVAAPIIKNNAFAGAILGSIKLDEISKLIVSKNFKNVNQSYIFDKSGNLLVSTKVPANLDIFRQNIKKVQLDKSGNIILNYSNDNGRNVLGSYTLLAHKNWILVNEVDISQNIDTVRKSTILAGVLTLFMITLLLIPSILYITRRLTHPLRNISRLASEFAIGNFDNRIIYKSNDEIGVLASSFNAMADKLQYIYTELTKRIDDLNTQKEEINLKNLKLEQVIEINRTILDKLEENNNQLEQASKVKAEFLTTMSHELRTPMNSIIGYTEMILDGNDGDINEEQRKDLEIILKSAENLLAMINDVLDLSKIEAGKMTYKYKNFDIINEISLLIENIKVMYQSKSLELIFEYDEEIKEIYSDPVKINHIVSNLLSNAVKFTDQGFIKVFVKEEEHDYISITVSDTGIGMPENELNTIFDEFKQLDGSSTRKYGGTGLGLTISKALIEGLGGTISVDSKVGVGSTFKVCIPLTKTLTSAEESEKKTTDIENVDAAIDNLKSGNIIVVTRNNNNYNSIQELLSEYSFNVINSDYSTAIEAIKLKKPGCIFIDIDLPCSNCNEGWLVLADLKQDKTTNQIPIVIVSTQSDNSLSFTLGATDYLIKPFTKQDILNSVNKAFTKHTRGYCLLIDDNRDNFNLISRAIRKTTNFSILMANSPKDISNILNSSNLPNIIFVNGTLSEISIFEIINMINSVDIDRKIPIIAFAEKPLNTLEHEFLKQNSKRILVKQDIRYSKLVNEIKQLTFE